MRSRQAELDSLKQSCSARAKIPRPARRVSGNQSAHLRGDIRRTEKRGCEAPSHGKMVAERFACRYGHGGELARACPTDLHRGLPPGLRIVLPPILPWLGAFTSALLSSLLISPLRWALWLPLTLLAGREFSLLLSRTASAIQLRLSGPHGSRFWQHRAGQALRETNNMMNRVLSFAGKTRRRGLDYVGAVSSYQAHSSGTGCSRSPGETKKAANYGAEMAFAAKPAFHFSAKEVHAIVDNIPEPRNVPRSWTQTSLGAQIFLSRSRSRPFSPEDRLGFFPHQTFSWSWDLKPPSVLPDARTAYHYTQNAVYLDKLVETLAKTGCSESRRQRLELAGRPSRLQRVLRNWIWAYFLLFCSAQAVRHSCGIAWAGIYRARGISRRPSRVPLAEQSPPAPSADSLRVRRGLFVSTAENATCRWLPESWQNSGTAGPSRRSSRRALSDVSRDRSHRTRRICTALPQTEIPDTRQARRTYRRPCGRFSSAMHGTTLVPLTWRLFSIRYLPAIRPRRVNATPSVLVQPRPVAQSYPCASLSPSIFSPPPAMPFCGTMSNNRT